MMMTNAPRLQGERNFTSMPAVLKLDKHGASMGVWHITEKDDVLLAQLQLNDRELKLIETLKHSKRYLHWLSSRVMLRHLINTDKFIELTSDEKRKPTLKNFPHHVSFSHSHDMAAVIISEHDSVGIDIELINPKVQRIKHKFMSEQALALIDAEDQVLQLITCWCAKEALFKLYGKGGVDFIADLHLDLPLPHNGVIAAQITKEMTSHHVYTMQLDDYVLAYVVGEVRTS